MGGLTYLLPASSIEHRASSIARRGTSLASGSPATRRFSGTRLCRIQRDPPGAAAVSEGEEQRVALIIGPER